MLFPTTCTYFDIGCFFTTVFGHLYLLWQSETHQLPRRWCRSPRNSLVVDWYPHYLRSKIGQLIFWIKNYQVDPSCVLYMFGRYQNENFDKAPLHIIGHLLRRGGMGVFVYLWQLAGLVKNGALIGRHQHCKACNCPIPPLHHKQGFRLNWVVRDLKVGQIKVIRSTPLHFHRRSNQFLNTWLVSICHHAVQANQLS